MRENNIPQSEFYMWRAVFAFSLVDHMLSLEEQKLLQSSAKTVPFSQTQIDILKNDFKKPQNVEDLYRKITNPKDKQRFCVLARALAWCEGNMDRQEETILKKLSCLAKGADDDVLSRTRGHPHVDAYYRQYTKAGMVGLFKTPPAVKMYA